MGNRLTAAGVADNWSYNDNNELQGYAGITFEYDDNGNMTKKTDAGQVTHYIYNVEDRLERVEDGSGSLISQYYYDPFGRRLWKEVNGVRTYFVYADEGLVAEVDEAGSVTKSYGYRPGSTWTTDPLFMKVGAQYYFYQNDHLGTPQKLTAVNGAVVWSAKYSSFGEADVDPSSTVENNLRFAGQYFDIETGLHYNWWRYYYPRTGRYLRPDPIGLSSGVNLYSYAFNSPIQFRDPHGLEVEIYFFDQRDKPNSKREYTAIVFVYVDGEYCGSFRGSTYPNNPNIHNTLNPGWNEFNNASGHKQGTKKGLNICKDKDETTLDNRTGISGTDPSGNAIDMDYVNIHSGVKPEDDPAGLNRHNRGSAGCPTIHPSDAEAFFDCFDWSCPGGTTGSSKGDVFIWKGPPEF